MTDQLPVPQDSDPVTQPRSRRALLAGMLGGIGAAAAAVIGLVPRAEASAGNPIIMGSSTNNAGTSNTVLTTNSSVVAFELLQHGGGTALMGYVTPSSGPTRGVYGRSDSAGGDGVQARNGGAHGTGAAVRAFGGQNRGVDASSDYGEGVYGAGNTIGVSGYSQFGYGVLGVGDSTVGVYGISTSGYGMYAQSDTNQAGHFAGELFGEVVNATVKNFRIDHPADPGGKVLTHSCVESNERKLVYDGVVTTDADGQATVSLPDYFDALGSDPRYQLTVIGSFAQAMVKSEIGNNRFTIATSEPRTKVSWQVTGVRADPYAKAHPLVVEAVKTGREKGRYLNPIEHGQPASAGVDSELRQQLVERGLATHAG